MLNYSANKTLELSTEVIKREKKSIEIGTSSANRLISDKPTSSFRPNSLSMVKHVEPIRKLVERN